MRGATLLLLAVAAVFSASAFLDAGPPRDRGGAGDGREDYVPPGMRCGAANLCDEREGARGEADGVSPEPRGGHDGR